jgi:serine protease inhibitor
VSATFIVSGILNAIFAFLSWLNNLSIPFNNRYADKLNLELSAINFQDSPMLAAQKINMWVSNKTEGKIHNIISTNDITEKTCAVLANTILLDAEWLYKFNKSQTQKDVFYNYNNSIDSAYFMNQVGNFNYYENEDFKIIDLPYIGGEFSLMIVLPTRINEYYPAIPKEVFEIIMAQNSLLKLEKVKVSLPKFSAESSISCEELLRKMNVTHLFSTESNLTKMFPDEKIFVNKIFQKNLLEINEERSVFVSTTLHEMVAYSNVSKNKIIKEFKADHPFIYLLKSNKHNLILSLGQILTIY